MSKHANLLKHKTYNSNFEFSSKWIFDEEKNPNLFFFWPGEGAVRGGGEREEEWSGSAAEWGATEIKVSRYSLYIIIHKISSS